MKLWTGRIKKETNPAAHAFHSSISFDNRMYREDIEGSIAHAQMLSRCGVIEASEGAAIVAGLSGILSDIEAGRVEFDPNSEDIHSFVEAMLTARIGDAGKRLHTGRSRNDQVALDIRIYLKRKGADLKEALLALLVVLHRQSEANKDTILPGYTHLQRAQPVCFAHVLLAYSQMLRRDIGRLDDTLSRMDEMPLGSGALAGTTYPIDRDMVRETLGFARLTENSLDGVSDRDFVIELASTLSIIMMHLSRFSEEIILWASSEFSFIELDDTYATGSSIMPQKKNPDMAELARGKAGRVFGHLLALLTMMKGLPLAYNKDMQEDKEAIFDAIDNTEAVLIVFAGMVDTMRVKSQSMRAAAGRGFINATDCADYLTKLGVPFRDAYKAVGELVAVCAESGETLESLPLEKYKEISPLFEEDIYEAISLETCLVGRDLPGGPGPGSVAAQLDGLMEFLKRNGVTT